MRQIELRLERYETRQPFGFARSLVHKAPLLMARAAIESEGGGITLGHSADLLVPGWFDKRPEIGERAGAAQLAEAASVAAARFHARGQWPVSLFELWWRVFQECVEQAQGDPPELVRGFGVALIERALIDALCRAARSTFSAALRSNLFEIVPESVHPLLADWRVENSLPRFAAREIRVRHTIGLADPLAGNEQESPRRRADGLPHSLIEYIQAHGLEAFKVKLCGDAARDRQRLLAIPDILREYTGANVLLTLDANEQYQELLQLLTLLRDLEKTPAGRFLLDHLAYLEQPLPRARAIHRSVENPLRELSRIAPVILDESDATSTSFERAIACGYRGVSIKNCKGIFRAILHRGLCERLGEGLFLSAEDLTTLPILPLQQDLATVAALGMEHVERNGHHYFERLLHLPPPEREAALRMHPDLYCDRGAGAELSIEKGRIKIASLTCEGLGYLTPIDFERRTPLSEWTFD